MEAVSQVKKLMIYDSPNGPGQIYEEDHSIKIWWIHGC